MALKVRRGGGQSETEDAPGVDATASARLIAAANKLDYVTTAAGMRLGVRKLGALDEMRMTRAVGAADASNQQYMLWCSMAAMIAEIDGEQQAMPETQLEFEAIIQRIGDAGVQAMFELAQQKAAALTKKPRKR